MGWFRPWPVGIGLKSADVFYVWLQPQHLLLKTSLFIFRRQYDVVRDPVEHSLNDENLLLEKCRTVLKQKCEDSFDKLRDLEEIKQKLEIDLQDKTEALRIDIDQLELTERSTGLSHKPDPLKVFFWFI